MDNKCVDNYISCPKCNSFRCFGCLQEQILAKIPLVHYPFVRKGSNLHFKCCNCDFMIFLVDLEKQEHAFDEVNSPIRIFMRNPFICNEEVVTFVDSVFKTALDVVRVRCDNDCLDCPNARLIICKSDSKVVRVGPAAVEVEKWLVNHSSLLHEPLDKKWQLFTKTGDLLFSENEEARFLLTKKTYVRLIKASSSVVFLAKKKPKGVVVMAGMIGGSFQLGSTLRKHGKKMICVYCGKKNEKKRKCQRCYSHFCSATCHEEFHKKLPFKCIKGMFIY